MKVNSKIENTTEADVLTVVGFVSYWIISACNAVHPRETVLNFGLSHSICTLRCVIHVTVSTVLQLLFSAWPWTWSFGRCCQSSICIQSRTEEDYLHSLWGCLHNPYKNIPWVSHSKPPVPIISYGFPLAAELFVANFYIVVSSFSSSFAFLLSVPVHVIAENECFLYYFCVYFVTLCRICVPFLRQNHICCDGMITRKPSGWTCSSLLHRWPHNRWREAKATLAPWRLNLMPPRHPSLFVSIFTVIVYWNLCLWLTIFCAYWYYCMMPSWFVSRMIAVHGAATCRLCRLQKHQPCCHLHAPESFVCCQWVSSFLTAHQHNIGYAVPYY